MTLAPCFAASPMYLACFSIIESLSPVHEHWTNAALTVAMSRSPLSGQRMARSGPLRHPAALEPVRQGRRIKEQNVGGRKQGPVTGGMTVKRISIVFAASALVAIACGQPQGGAATGSPAPSAGPARGGEAIVPTWHEPTTLR